MPVAPVAYAAGVPAGAKFLAEDARSTAKWQPVTHPALVRVSDDPPVFEVPGFLSPEECEHVRKSGEPGLARSIVVDGAAGKSPAPSRTSESCYLDSNAAGLTWLQARVSALCAGKAMATQEPVQVARYLPGQFYLAHYDAFDITTGPGRECVATGGQRVGEFAAPQRRQALASYLLNAHAVMP